MVALTDMRGKPVFVFILAAAFCAGACASRGDDLAGGAFSFADEQLRFALKQVGEAEGREGNSAGALSPRTVREDGTLMLVRPGDWTSGFFPGELWLMYEYTGDEFWKSEAEKFTANLEGQKTNGRTHDMGFKMYCSFGNGYRLTSRQDYADILLESAATLATRFNPAVGCIRSWDHHREKWRFPVIIDNMMNLELLFWAYRQTGDRKYYDIAVSHALTTMKNHFRPDFSSYHVVDYDPVTGEVLARQTHQGFDDESSWARGQAWGLYGYVMCYRETRDSVFLRQAEDMAGYMLEHLPEDGVLYWDFDDPAIPDAPRDASASAIAASSLYELSLYAPAKSEEYKAAADTIVEGLYSECKSPLYENCGFLLQHSTGAWNSEIDVPLVYADYYFLEALLRKDAIENARSAKDFPDIWGRDYVLRAAKAASRGDTTLVKAFAALVDRCDSELVRSPYSVMDKVLVPPSGDKHDYVSMGRYWWPDPSSPDGRPYIRRDGHSNPELKKLDRDRMGGMMRAVSELSLCYFFTEDEKYAEKAVSLLRVWFMDESTRMNPNMEYAQYVPGHNGDRGRAEGLLDTYGMVEMLGSLAYLSGSEAYTAEVDASLRRWFGEYLRWMLISRNGMREQNAENNHSVAYDVQIVAFSIFTGDMRRAEKTVAEFAPRRIFLQVAPDGSQPRELARATGFGYSIYNINHFLDMCMLVRGLGEDRAGCDAGELFSMTPDGSAGSLSSVKGSIEYLRQFLGEPQEAFPYRQIKDWDAEQDALAWVLRRASLFDGASGYKEDFLAYDRTVVTDLMNIIYAY